MESLTPTNRTATSKQFQDRKKREKAQRARGVATTTAQRLKHPAEQPSLCQRLQLPHCGVRRPAAPPTPSSPVPSPCGDRAGCGHGVLCTVLKNQKCQFAPRQAGLPRPPPRPAGPPLNARTPQAGLALKTSLFFGFFVCFEFIQSLRNLWFWLEI